MGQGQQGQPHVPVKAGPDILGGPEVGAQIAVAEHHALGTAGSTGGVDDGGQVVGLYVRFGGQLCRLIARSSLDDGKIVKADNQLQAVNGFRQDFRQQFPGYEQGSGLRVLEYVLDLALGEVRKHRNGDHAECG